MTVSNVSHYLVTSQEDRVTRSQGCPAKETHNGICAGDFHFDEDLVGGDIKIPHSRMTKTYWGNIGNLFVICMYATSDKRPFVPPVGGIGLVYNL